MTTSDYCIRRLFDNLTAIEIEIDSHCISTRRFQGSVNTMNMSDSPRPAGMWCRVEGGERGRETSSIALLYILGSAQRLYTIRKWRVQNLGSEFTRGLLTVLISWWNCLCLRQLCRVRSIGHVRLRSSLLICSDCDCWHACRQFAMLAPYHGVISLFSVCMVGCVATFLIAFHWSNFDISDGFLTKWSNDVIVISSPRGTSGKLQMPILRGNPDFTLVLQWN